MDTAIQGIICSGIPWIHANGGHETWTCPLVVWDLELAGQQSQTATRIHIVILGQPDDGHARYRCLRISHVVPLEDYGWPRIVVK